MARAWIILALIACLALSPLALAQEDHVSPKLLWKYDTGDGPIRGSPAVFNGTVFFCSGDTIYAVKNDSVTWKHDLGQFAWSSLVYDSGRVYAGDNGGNITVLNAADGSVVWTYHTGAAIHAAVSVYRNKVFALSKDFSAYCFDMNGTLLWSYKTGDVLRSDPCFFDNKVYFVSEDKFFYALNVDTGVLAWRSVIVGQTGQKAVEYNGKVYTCTYLGGIYCFDAGTGRTEWTKVKQDQTVFGNLGIVDDSLYYTTDAGTINCLNPFTGGAYWSINTTHRLRDEIEVQENVLVVLRDDGYLVELYSKDGSIISTTELPDAKVPGKMTLTDKGVLYIGDEKGQIYAYQLYNFDPPVDETYMYVIVGGLILLIMGAYVITRVK